MEQTVVSNNKNNSNNGSGNSDYEKIISWFEDVSNNTGSVQTEILSHILKENNGVEYLKKWFGGYNILEMEACALESLFSSLVPIASHADFEPFIQRISDGDTAPLLTQQPITTLSLSSGTTDGRQKFVPFTRHSAQTTLQIFTLSAAYRSRIVQVQTRRRGGSGRISQWDPKIELCMQKKTNSNSQHRQKH
ncbi:hypothetical protein KIW84_075241 [Lathyrus oleraceus]|uniref:Uncharacterized protein n=1 Tax=Pisum sativum TaxID=3888 RepID=A0A9D5A0U5_PEA|nr:hypothetical protein KIW84_075241 [Pisum sativum]